jgi:diaminopimelate decarboxylase
MDDSLLVRLAGEYGTPLYVYDGGLVQARCREFKGAFRDFPVEVKCCYALKANSSLALLRLIQREGYGADVVSRGELDAALKAGFRPEHIMYTSNSKCEADLQAAVEAGVNVTVDNTSEIEVLRRVGGDKVAFRVNPDVDANTHPKISTALRDSKFGLHLEGNIAYNAVRQAKKMGLKVVGLHCHIGSNIKDASVFRDAAGKMLDFAVRLWKLGIKLDFIDLGGGLGIRYRDEGVVTPAEFAQSFRGVVIPGIEQLGYTPDVWFEPGRYIVGEAGVLLARVNSVKSTPEKTFINVDAGFNDLIRPAMYDAYHNVRVAGKAGADRTYDVAGNLCESGDILARDRNLPEVMAGDVIVVENAGAYGYAMASSYNSMPLPAEVLVRGDRIDLIRNRQDIQEIYIRQKIPEDLL